MESKDPQRLANQLFWINLVPSIIAIPGEFMMTLGIRSLEFGQIVCVLLVAGGLAAEFFYALQRTDEILAFRKSLWLYSIFLNVAFITTYMVGLATSLADGLNPGHALVVVLGLYPCICLFLSIKALKLVKQSI